jgi:hypothetical protein
MTSNYAETYESNVQMLGRECADALRRLHVADSAPDADKGDVRGTQGGPKFWMRKLAELLKAMMNDPEIAAMISGKTNGQAPTVSPAMPGVAPGGGKVPPVVPGPRNPSGASEAPELPGGKAHDSLEDLLPTRRAERRTLADVVTRIKTRSIVRP